MQIQEGTLLQQSLCSSLLNTRCLLELSEYVREEELSFIGVLRNPIKERILDPGDLDLDPGTFIGGSLCNALKLKNGILPSACLQVHFPLDLSLFVQVSGHYLVACKFRDRLHCLANVSEGLGSFLVREMLGEAHIQDAANYLHI